MAYGRMDVFWPDGSFQSFPLSEGNVSVGRSPSATITLDTETISRYHFSINHAEGQVMLADMESANGTYIDGVKLASGEQRELGGGEEVTIGHLRIIYHHMDEMDTQPVGSRYAETTERIELTQPSFRIAAQPPPQPVTPGSHFSADLTITNTGEEQGWYTVEATGVPRQWVRIDRPKLTLDPGETAQIVVNFKPVRHHETAPGEYPVKLVVREESNPAAALEAGIVLRVLPFSGFGAALERHHIGGGERFRLHIHNQGSGELPLSVTSNPLGPVNIVFSTASKLTLGPGQRAIIQGDVKPRQAIIIGQPKDHDFDLVVKSGDAAGFTAAVRGQYQQVALMPVWAPFVVAAALAVVITLAVLLITIISAPRPNIAAFDVQNTRIVRGETLNIEWAVTDVAQLEVLVNGTPAVSDIDPEVGGVALDTTNLPDNAVISLVGTNRGAQVSSEQLVQVAPPLQLTTFIADPPQLVRYVVQPLSLEWEVANAEFTRISGLEALTGVAIGDSFGPEGNVTDLLGIPQNPLVLTIYAESALGTTMTETIRIEVIDPRCTAIGGPVQLYAGPNPANQVVGSVPEATSVIVDAQDEDGGWLRVQLTGGIAGWGPLAAFDCNSTFAPSSLRKVVDVVTPVPSPTVTATETPNLGPTPTTRFETAGTPEPTASG